MTAESLAALLVPCAECTGEGTIAKGNDGCNTYPSSEPVVTCPACHGYRYPALLRHLSEQEERLARYANPWTVEIRNQVSLHWQEFAHDAPLTLKESEKRMADHCRENIGVELRVVPWLNPDQRQHAAERIKELERERDAALSKLEQVDDILICNWVGPRKDGDYRKALQDLISTSIREHNDPLISESAKLSEDRNAELRDRLARAESLYKWRPIAEIHEDYGPCVLMHIDDPENLAVGSNLNTGFDELLWTHFAQVPKLTNEEADELRAAIAKSQPGKDSNVETV